MNLSVKESLLEIFRGGQQILCVSDAYLVCGHVVEFEHYNFAFDTTMMDGVYQVRCIHCWFIFTVRQAIEPKDLDSMLALVANLNPKRATFWTHLEEA